MQQAKKGGSVGKTVSLSQAFECALHGTVYEVADIKEMIGVGMSVKPDCLVEAVYS
jgi:hypothetical protein